MILENISRALREQNWLAAAIEFVIVIAGVVIGFQINAWAAGRADRAAEHAFYVRLASELQETESLHYRLFDRRRGAFQDLTEAVALIQAQDSPPLSEAQCYAVASSVIVAPGVIGLSSVDELLSGAGLQRVTDEPLREELVEFVSRAELFQQTLGDNDLFPLTSNFPDLIEASSYIQDDGEVRLAARCDTAAMRNSTGFKNQLVRNFDSQDSLINNRWVPFLESRERLAEKVSKLLAADP